MQYYKIYCLWPFIYCNDLSYCIAARPDYNHAFCCSFQNVEMSPRSPIVHWCSSSTSVNVHISGKCAARRVRKLVSRNTMHETFRKSIARQLPATQTLRETKCVISESESWHLNARRSEGQTIRGDRQWNGCSIHTRSSSPQQWCNISSEPLPYDFMLFIWQRTYVTERGQWIHAHTHTQYTRRVCSIHAQDGTSGRVVSFSLTLFTWIK